MFARSYAILLSTACVFAFLSPNKVWSENLSFDQAVAKTLSYSPKLRIADSEINEAAGLKTQSALLPNPVAGWSVENVFGKFSENFDFLQKKIKTKCEQKIKLSENAKNR